MLHATRLPVLDASVDSLRLLSLREILDCQVAVDKDYIRLRAKEGLELALDLRKLGLVMDGSELGSALFSSISDAQSSPIVDLTVDEAMGVDKTMAEEPGTGPSEVKTAEDFPVTEQVEEGKGPYWGMNNLLD